MCRAFRVVRVCGVWCVSSGVCMEKFGVEANGASAGAGSVLNLLNLDLDRQVLISLAA